MAAAAGQVGEHTLARQTEATRNVILLGLSQHGKTTFMNGLVKQQQSISPEGEMGTGNERCTSTPQLVDLHPPGQFTQVLKYERLPKPAAGWFDGKTELEGQALEVARKKWWKQMSKDTDFRADVTFEGPLKIGRNLVSGRSPAEFRRTPRGALGKTVGFAIKKMTTTEAVQERVRAEKEVQKEAKKAQKEAQKEVRKLLSGSEDDASLRVRALDTPGVEDSKGEDDAHIEKVIEMVLEMGALSGLAMVTKCGTPITPAWKAQVSRYHRLFPMMEAQWVFIHTNADPCSVNRRNKNSLSFETVMQERVDAVNAAMFEISGQDDFAASHLFIESNIEEEEGEDEVLKSYLAEQHNVFFTLIANFTPVAIDELPFEKGPRLLTIDRSVKSAIEATVLAISSTVRHYDADLANLMKMREQHAAEVALLLQKLAKVRGSLAEIDHDGPIKIQKPVEHPWCFFSHPKVTVDVWSPHQQCEVSILDTSGYTRRYLTEESRYIVETNSDGRSKYRVTVKVQHIWTTLKGMVIVSSKSRAVHSEKIVELQRQERILQKQVDAMNAIHAQQEDQLGVVNDRKSFAGRRHDTATAMISFLNVPWFLHVWKVMKPFYDGYTPEMTVPNLVNNFQLQWRRFVQVSCIELTFEPADLTTAS